MGVNFDFGGDPGFCDEAIAGGSDGCDTVPCGVDRPEGEDNAGDEVGDVAGDVGLTVSLRD